MKASQAVALFEAMAATSKRSEKEALLAGAFSDPLLMQDIRLVCYLALNTRIAFGIDEATMPKPELFGTRDDLSNEDLLSLGPLSSGQARGAAAQKLLLDFAAEHTPSAWDVVQRILLKNLRCGVGAGTVNKAFGGRVIPITPYMRCSLQTERPLDDLDWEEGVYVQQKMDGMFANLLVWPSGAPSLLTRDGFPFQNDLGLVTPDLLRRASGKTFMGELLVQGPDGDILPRQTGNGMLNGLRQGTSTLPDGHTVKMVVWDCVTVWEFDERHESDIPYELRLAQLNEILPPGAQGVHLSRIPTWRVHSKGAAMEIYADILRKGGEGAIAKTRHGSWFHGTSRDQVKLKLEFECDLRVEERVASAKTSKNADMFGSLRCSSSCGMLETSVSGFSDKLRAQLHAEGDGLIGGIITVKANDIMPPSESNPLHSLFLPRFVERRLDKGEADSLSRIKEIKASAIMSA